MGDSETERKPMRLPKKAAKVKNKAPAPLQITAEQLLREAKERELEISAPPPRIKITDPEELAEFNRKRRKEFEDNIRKNRLQIANWVKYGKWEESIGEMQRARSIFERALEVDHRNITIWLQYAEMEMRNKQVNHARNIFDRAITILPRATQFWLKYTYMEELIENVPGARQVFERWMAWEPDQQAWQTYINFELRYGEVDRARRVWQQFLAVHSHDIRLWIRYARFEEKNGNEQNARIAYEQAIEFFQDELDASILVAFAQFEERKKEHERARMIYKYALEHLPSDKTAEVYKHYTAHEKKYGERIDVENAIVSKRRRQYEQQIAENSYNYDAWFDYIRLLQNEQVSREEMEDCFERAISNIPPYKEKRSWRRYIYLWINYALYEELEVKDYDKTREVYNACLTLIPHESFTFAKMWDMFAEFEIRRLNLTAARKIMGTAIGKCPKSKLFKKYINLELQLREFDRCRKLYEKFVEFAPENSSIWIKFAELEALLGDVDRARGIYDIAIHRSALDMPEVLWKAYIDFEISQEEYDRVRGLYERLLERTNHIKVWISLADFESSIEEIERARKVYELANEALKNEDKSERVMLLEAWKEFENTHGDKTSREAVAKQMPKKMKKRRAIQNDDGVDAGWEEYYDYVFPMDQTNTGQFKLMEAALRWKKQNLPTEEPSEAASPDKEQEDEARPTSSRLHRMTDVPPSESGAYSLLRIYKSWMDESWFLRFLIILCAYSTVGLPAYFVIRYVKKRNQSLETDESRRSFFYSFLVRFSIGLDRKSYLPVATDEKSSLSSQQSVPVVTGRRNLLEDCAALLFCFFGIQSSLIVMGFLQERLMTQGYKKIPSESVPSGIIEKFGDTQFLMLMNRLFSMLIYGSYIFYNRRRQPPHVAPYYVHSYTSLSNTMSSWCQYEALKYVTFPTQTVCKASKIIPTMIMGRIVRNERYSVAECMNALVLAFGASLFFLSSTHSRKSTAELSGDYTMTVSGLILMAGYLAFDAFTPNWQKSLFDTKPKISKYQMIFGTSVFSAILCVVSLAEQATLCSSFDFFLSHEGFQRDVFLLSLSGAVSQMFIYTTIERFGPIVLTILLYCAGNDNSLMMEFSGAGFDGIAEDAESSAIYYAPNSQHTMCDPWTWDSLDISVLEDEDTSHSQHAPDPVDVVYEFPFDIATATESEAESSSSRSKTDKPYQCTEAGCGLSFKSRSSLNRHWRTKHEHGGLAKFTCPDCEGVSFNYHSDLLVHQRTAHEGAPPAKRSIPCLQCPAMFRTTADLDTHIARVHEKLKMHECPQCHEMFDREFTLQMHIKRRHSIRRDFQCPYCRKMFANLYDLVHFHAPVCSTPRDFQPYKCALCPQTYRHATSLSRHKRFAHGNATIADVRQSQLKLVVCDREQRTHVHQNHAMTKTIEDRTLGSIRGLFTERPPEALCTPTMDISGDLNLMFTQHEVDPDAPSSSRTYPVWSSTYESEFSDSAISSMEGFLSG
ncbi:hypothetical protein QR680_005641 [Steinernema hermaphroditum]|uniref:C2H2-type domain-containing protein n=1 Tax=Steinernema hermaphroditum TaxID=289476 RepID=A0AA39HSU5_9BILA|nr:hypothetical protein QR680_005641 [Steinernema hermaphroditum]